MQSWIPLLLLPLLLAPSATAQPMKIYVSPEGDDHWTGRAPQREAATANGPFATIARARDEARKALPEARGKGGVEIWLRGGTYFLTEPLVLTPGDSGAPSAPVTYAAFKDEIPILSGGVPITGWKVTTDGRWQATVPGVAEGEWYFAQLFVNDQRRHRPRLPKQGYFYIAGEYPATGRGKGFDRFRYYGEDVKPGWSHLHEIEVYTFSPWFMPRQRISAIDPVKHVLTLEGATGRAAEYAKLGEGVRYLVENVADALTEPGEFYLDRKTGVVKYVPMPGEDPATAKVVAPKLEQVLVLEGDSRKAEFVHDIQFRGIVFEHTNWELPKAGYISPQAEVTVPGTILVTNARQIVFDGCTVCRTGNYGIELGHGCQHNRIENCVLSDLGAGGVKIGEQRGTDNETLATSYNVVRNCLIAHGGRTHPGGIGVWIGQSHHNTVEHCEMFDFYYTTISSGWTWGYGKSYAHDNLILDNKLHDIGQNVLSDMGAFYNLGASPGTVVRGNRVDNVESYTYGGWGLYTDEGSTGVLLENNVVTRTKSGGFHQHYGKENRITNNLFIDGREQQLKRTRKEDHLSFTFDHNVVSWKTGILFDGFWSDDKVAIDSNCYWKQGEPIDFGGGATIDQRKATGHDGHSIIADPGLSKSGDDYALPADSVAVTQLGLKPFDVKGAGLIAPLHSPAAKLDGAFPPTFPVGTTPPPPGPQQPISEDFEETPVGSVVSGVHTAEDKEIKRATARVTNTVAAGGKQSLKFTDAPGQKANYTPMVVWQPRFMDGVIVGSFDVRMDTGGDFAHDWRTAGSPYVTGPNIRFKDGAFTAGGKKLLDYPPGQWIHVEISCGIGKQAAGLWDVSITLPGEPPRQFTGLACKKEFDALRWYGFVSAGTGDGVFYIDNVNVQQK